MSILMIVIMSIFILPFSIAMYYLLLVKISTNTNKKVLTKKSSTPKTHLEKIPKENIRKWQEFIKMVEKLSLLSEEKSKFQYIRDVSLEKSGLIRFSLNEEMNESRIMEEFNIIKEYSSIKMLITQKNIDKFTSKTKRINYQLTMGGLWELSKDDFDNYCETKLNPLFKMRMEKIIQLVSDEELFTNMWPLVNKYEITFNTVLNVIDEYREMKTEQHLSEEIEDKILKIIDNFEQDVTKVKKQNKELKDEIDKGLEKSLNERLEIEVELLNKTSTS
jgi:hypothetical protein